MGGGGRKKFFLFRGYIWGMLNLGIKGFKAYVRRGYFTKGGDSELDGVYVFGIQSVGGKVLTFHVMTDYGMLRSRVPIGEICFGEVGDDLPVDYKQLWDCFSESVVVTYYEYLEGKRCKVLLKDKREVWCTYMFTVDWYDNGYSEDPTDYKCGHVLRADGGYLMCQPNNRIYWRDCNWITKDFPVSPREIKVDTVLESVEGRSDRWVSEDSDCFYYDVKNIEE